MSSFPNDLEQTQTHVISGGGEQPCGYVTASAILRPA